jgi:hypothetical protein
MSKVAKSLTIYDYYSKLLLSVGQPAARGPHAALGSLSCGPSTLSRNRPFKEKSSKSLKFSENLALHESIFLKCGPWPHLGWPTLTLTDSFILNIHWFDFLVSHVIFCENELFLC